MDVYHVAQLSDCGLAAHQHAGLLDKVGSVGTKGVASQDTSTVGLREELEHTLGLAHGQCLAIGAPESLAALVRRTFLLQHLFSGTDTGGLWLGEDSGGHRVSACGCRW